MTKKKTKTLSQRAREAAEMSSATIYCRDEYAYRVGWLTGYKAALRDRKKEPFTRKQMNRALNRIAVMPVERSGRNDD